MNNETKWTPGPWHAVTGDDARLKNGSGRLFPRVYIGPCEPERIRGHLTINETTAGASMPEFDANARLIAAAPELYAELADLAAYAEFIAAREPGMDELRAHIANARAALAKARGEA